MVGVEARSAHRFRDLHDSVVRNMVHLCRPECDPRNEGTPNNPYCKDYFPKSPK
mgnify:CR=1 FL=1